MPFSDILGHSRETSILKSAIGSGKVAHSYLFAGPDGIGKSLAAREFARALNCEVPTVDGDSCGTCASCLQAFEGNHPSILNVWPTDKVKEGVYENVLEGGGLIRVHQVRDIQEFLRFRIDRGKKAVIVNCADRFMAQAANAFLKTLEEPPPDSVIVLVTAKPSDLLPTILSRCQRISFRPLSTEAVGEYISKVRSIPPDQAAFIARLSAGSIGAALAHAGEGAFDKRKEVVTRLMELTPADVDKALKLAEELSKRDDLEDVLEFLKSWYRDRLVYMEGLDGLIVNSDLSELLAAASKEDAGRLVESFEQIERTRFEVTPPRYGNRQLAMEVLLMRLAGCR